MIARDAFACVTWFDYFLKKLVDLFIGFKPITAQRGLFGTPISHAGSKEGTQRGSTHLHDKFTTKEFVFIRKILRDVRLRALVEPAIRRFVDTILSNSIFAMRKEGDQSSFVKGNDSETTTIIVKNDNGTDFGSVLPFQLPIKDCQRLEPAFGTEFRERIKDKIRKKQFLDPEVKLFIRIGALTQTRQMHGLRRTDIKDGTYLGRVCNHTCKKSKISLLTGTCRFRFGKDGKELVDKTFLDADGNIILARNNSHVVTNSPAFLSVVGSNICFDLIKTGRDGTAMDLYLTGYTTKSELSTGRIFSILASDKREAPAYSTNVSLKSYKKMTARFLNLLMGSMDLSQQHVAMCLLNIDREIISHKTFQIFTGRFYQMLTNTDDNDGSSFLLENCGNGLLRLSCFAEDYSLRSPSLSSNIGRLSVVSSAQSVFKRRDLTGERLHVTHPQYSTHTLRFKKILFKINLMGPLFLSAKAQEKDVEKFAQCVLLFFKPWLINPISLKTHDTWLASLTAWSFKNRILSDSRWYLRVSENLIVPSHPIIENIRDMFEGKDRAMRERKLLKESLKAAAATDKIDSNEAGQPPSSSNENSKINSEKTLPSFANNSNIMYIPGNNIRKKKILDHISLVTSCYLEMITPSMSRQDFTTPVTTLFPKTSLNIITSAWKTYSPPDDVKNKSTSCYLACDHPYQNMIFTFVPNDSCERWSSDSTRDPQSNQEFVQFLAKEFSSDGSIRLVDFIVASGTTARQAIASLLLEISHSAKLRNKDMKGVLTGIFGKPGTGKSHTFLRIFEPYLKAMGESKTLQKGSFTGNAALNINAFTLHSQLGLKMLRDKKDLIKDLGKTTISKKTREAISDWLPILSLLIDEISQTSSSLLSQICLALTQLKECDNIFGGLNMFFFGDFYQMESISPSLYHPVNYCNETKITNNFNIEVTKGRNLWQQLNWALFLDSPQRSKEPIFNRIKRRLRNGCCQDEDISLLNSRCVQSCSKSDSNRFIDAPFYTSRHYEIDHVNEKRITYFSIQHNRQLVTWITVIKINGKSITPQSWIYDLLNQERHRFTQKNLKKIGRRFSYCEGAPYKILVTPKNGNRTGTVTSNIGRAVGIQLDPREPEQSNQNQRIRRLKYPPLAIFLTLRKHIMITKLPGLEEFELGTVPIIPMTESVTLHLQKINPRWYQFYKDPSFGVPDVLTISLFGYKLAPAFANTDYGCQSSTTPLLATNIVRGPYSTKTGTCTSAYVIITRSPSLLGILLSHPITKFSLQKTPTKDLIKETVRLRSIEQKTLKSHYSNITNLISDVEAILARLISRHSSPLLKKKWITSTQQYLTSLISELKKLLDVPKNVSTCVSCLEIFLSDGPIPRCLECAQDNIPPLEPQKCSCGTPIPWIQTDGVSRNGLHCQACSIIPEKKTKQKNITWKRKSCLSCSSIVASATGSFCSKCDPRNRKRDINIPSSSKKNIPPCFPFTNSPTFKIQPKALTLPGLNSSALSSYPLSFPFSPQPLPPIQNIDAKHLYTTLENPDLNLCFMNTAIQYLLSIPSVVTLISSLVHSRSCSQNCFLCEFEILAFSMLNNSRQTLICLGLAQKFQEIQPDYNIGEVWDCCEVIDTVIYMYDSTAPILPSLNPIDYTIISSSLVSTMRTTLQHTHFCTVCGSSSVSVEKVFSVLIPLTNPTNNVFVPWSVKNSEYCCHTCNYAKGFYNYHAYTENNPVPRIQTLCLSETCIKNPAEFMILRFGRVIPNSTLKVTHQITIPKTSIVANRLYILSSWGHHIGLRSDGGHYIFFRRHGSKTVLLDDSSCSFINSPYISNSSLCFLALLEQH